jgi:mycothiol synthase
MMRPNLDGLPSIQLPEAYQLRHFRPGDEKGWNRLMDVVFERKAGTTDFNTQMATDPAFRPDRVWLVVRGEEIIATASAWFGPKFGPSRGYLHWVGTHPDHRRMRLGYFVSVAAMLKMREDGRDSAVLQTDDFRLAAIKTYLNLDFQPLVVHENQRQRWKAVLESLRYPERFEAQLAAPLFQSEVEAADG